MVLRYALTVHVGNMDVSIQSDSREELLSKMEELRRLARKVEERAGRAGRRQGVEARKRVGKSEATEILRHLEEKLLPSGFFKETRSTGDVTAKLRELVGVIFQSRKVSQALGILYDKGALRRTGLKGSYKYFLPRP